MKPVEQRKMDDFDGPKYVAERLITLLQAETNLSETSRQSGVSRGVLIRAINGSEPNHTAMIRLCRYFGRPYEYFFDD